MSKSAREIKLMDEYIQSDKFSIKVGAIEQRDAPDTVYIYCSFWVEPNDEHKNKSQEELKELLSLQLNSIYKTELKQSLRDNEMFPLFNENIFIVNIPDNLNYNEGRNFISMEIYLHTKNIKSSEKFPLNSKKDTRLFNELLSVSKNLAASDIMSNNTCFHFYKSSKS